MLCIAHTLCLATDFCSGDHSPKSDAVPLANCWVMGLYARHCTESLCVYLRIPSACTFEGNNRLLNIVPSMTVHKHHMPLLPTLVQLVIRQGNGRTIAADLNLNLGVLLLLA